MKLSKIFVLLTAAALSLSLFSGCGGKEPQGEDSAGDIIGDIAETKPPDKTPEPSPAHTDEAAAEPEDTAKPDAPPVPSDTQPPSPSPSPSQEPAEAVVPAPAPTQDPVSQDDEPSPEPTQDPAPENSGSAVDLQAFLDTVLDKYEFPDLSDFDAEMKDAYFPGLSAIAVKQLIAKAPMVSISSSEIVLVECENSEDVAAVVKILEARRQAQVDGGAWYPECIEIWENAVVASNGNFVILICHENAADIAAAFNALFK